MHFNLPYSFDPAVLADRLLLTLQRSPHTKSLGPVRVHQIVQELAESAVLNDLKNQLKQLTICFEEKQEEHYILLQRHADLEQQYKQLASKYYMVQNDLKVREVQLSHHKKEQSFSAQKQKQKVERKNSDRFDQKCIKLQSQNAQLKKKVQDLQSVNQKTQFNFTNKVNDLQNKLRTKDQEIKEKTLQLNKFQLNRRQVEMKTAQIQQNKKQLQKRITIISQQLNQSQKKLEERVKAQQNDKKRISQLESTDKQKSEQIQRLTKKYEHLKREYNQFKDSVRDKFSSKQKQKKSLTEKLSQLTQKHHLEQRVLAKVRRQLKTVRQLKQQMQLMKRICEDEAVKLFKSVQKGFEAIMEEIGSNMNKELSKLASKISKITGELIIYKEEVKVKDQIIERLQRMLQQENNNTTEMRNELRIKKKEEERLRRELSQYYQQTELKLNSMQKKYKQVLSESSNTNNF